jgi:hypothetical protein
MNIDELFKCKDLSVSSLQSYKAKLTKLNENKPIKNLNFLSDIEKIKGMINKFKPNTQRNYIIAVASILKCSLTTNKNKKIETIYNNYSKLLEEYNTNLKDQTTKTDTENENWLSKEELDKIYNDIKNNYKDNKQTFQNYVLLSLYYLQAPRRNKDYQLLKLTSKYNDGLSNEFNYLDMKKKKFIFNNYKTAKKYNKQEVEINEELYQILNSYIKAMKLKDGDFIINDLKTNQPFKNTNAITLLLNRIFKKKIGASMLRKLYLTHKYGDQAQELKDDMKAMGSSVEVANNNYIKKK